jgi:hypothetical protein
MLGAVYRLVTSVVSKMAIAHLLALDEDGIAILDPTERCEKKECIEAASILGFPRIRLPSIFQQDVDFSGISPAKSQANICYRNETISDGSHCQRHFEKFAPEILQHQTQGDGATIESK